MNDNLMVSMVTQEIMDSPEAVVIYFASIANQSLAITERAVRDKTKRLHGSPFPTSSAGYCLRLLSRKGVKEALRNKTKNCCTGLTCRQNNTKS